MAKEIEGIHTVGTLAQERGISRRTAINYLSLLRKKGYVQQIKGGKKRLYKVSPLLLRTEGNPGLEETINAHSPMKLAVPRLIRLKGRKLSVEDAIVEAVKTGDYRIIIAAIPLFNAVKDWLRLSRRSEEEQVSNRVGAMYELARTMVRTRRMDKRVMRRLQKQRKKQKRMAHLIKGVYKDREFQGIGKKWGVVIGLRKADLMRLKEW